MRNPYTVVTVKLQNQRSAIKRSTASNIYSSITKVSREMDGMPNVVKIMLGHHNALLMRKNVLLVEKLKRRRKLVKYLKENELFLHIIQHVKYVVNNRQYSMLLNISAHYLRSNVPAFLWIDVCYLCL